ncbi:hypothetical protein EJV47_22000 [Hymenobacter gummosus]|uniref:YcxB family protein n=1 Tax=Hymenobacter gummosus TaxID=1776032 RepID=A0A431TWT4_9BACT|nr:hypothetical protein [Hymenobacter gummosus]RTQ46209.1 hypothetical protein EJV47_22000 [Hymenobacter gummosus]
MQPIVIADVTVSLKDFIHFHKQLLGWRAWALRLAPAAVLLYFLWSSGTIFPSTGWGIVTSGLIVAALLVLGHFSLRRALRKTYRGNPVFSQPLSYTLTDEAIAMVSSAGQGTFQWAAIRKVQSLPGWWLLNTTNSTTIFLQTSRVQPPRYRRRRNGPVPAPWPAVTPALMTPIIIPQVHLSFGRYFWLAWRFTLKTKPSMWLVVFPLLSIVSLVRGAVAGDAQPTANPGLALLQLVGIAAVLLIPYQMWRTYRRAPLLSGFNRYEFNADGLLLQNDVQQSQLAWVALLRFHRFGRWILLLSGEQVGVYIDLDRVQAPHTAADVLRLLEQHGIQRA